MLRNLKFISFFAALSFIYACQDEVPGNSGIPNEFMGIAPVVMVHGALASGDTYATQAQRFSSNGYDDSEIYAFDWNSVAGANPVDLLDLYIDEILEETKAPYIHLIGHSAGGGFCYQYMDDSLRALKINKYVHIASGAQSGPPGPNADISILNLNSPDDQTVPATNINGAINVSLAGKDHYEVATSEDSFKEIFTFLNDANPVVSGITQESNVTLSGRVVTLGENEAEADVNISIYELNDGVRQGSPVGVFMTDMDGNWGPFQTDNQNYLEFEISRNDGIFKTIHYYRSPFDRSDQFVYLRSLPDPNGLAGILLSTLPSDDSQSVIGIFSANQAMISGRDMLGYDNNELSTPALTSADQTTIALFLYDDGDEVSSGDAHASFGFTPFLNAADYFISTDVEHYSAVNLNGENLFFRNWKSQSEGYSVLVFN